MALNHIQITNAKPRDKAYKLADSDGLYLFIQPNGAKLWRMNYRHLGRQKTLSAAAAMSRQTCAAPSPSPRPSTTPRSPLLRKPASCCAALRNVPVKRSRDTRSG